MFAAPSLRLKTSSVEAGEASLFTVGSSLSLTCTYLNTSMLEAVSSTTLLPWQPGPPLKVKLPSSVLAWTCNNKTFSTQNRKRFVCLQQYVVWCVALNVQRNSFLISVCRVFTLNLN